MAGYGNRPSRASGGSVGGGRVMQYQPSVYDRRADRATRTAQKALSYLQRQRGAERDNWQIQYRQDQLRQLAQQGGRRAAAMTGLRVSLRSRADAARAQRARAQGAKRQARNSVGYGTLGTGVATGERIRRRFSRGQGNLLTGGFNDRTYGGFRRI